MEALYEYTQVDPNRNIFDMLVKVWSTANDDYRIDMQLNKSNYTNLSTFSVSLTRLSDFEFCNYENSKKKFNFYFKISCVY